MTSTEQPRRVPLRQFKADADVATAEVDRRTFVRNALAGYEKTRAATTSLYIDYAAARAKATAVKWEAIERLPELLEEFERNLTANGAQVHWAVDADSAVKSILNICSDTNAKRVIKSKSMATEEIHLNDHLLKSGFIESVIESDLGEWIQQLRDEPPYHFVFPSMHLKRGEIRETFSKRVEPIDVDEPEQLTKFARRHLRKEYIAADVGISGANFGVADVGAISITENEGNARLTCALPRVHIVVMGIEKMIPRMSDLAVMQPMLATCGTGQMLTGYNTLYFGPRSAGEIDGPTQMHIVLLDNGRSTLLADPELRDSLRCIRCGACLNVCPIFKNVGGFTYGTTYQGPIGSVITPPMRGVPVFGHLAYASSLCGACTETCPVGIDLHHHLLRLRGKAVDKKPKFFESMLMKGFSTLMRMPGVYRVGSRVGLTLDALTKPLHGTKLDIMRAWRRDRTLPPKPAESFTHWFAKRK